MSSDQDDRERIAELIERSSLGTPEAKAARESVSDEDAARVLARAGRHRRGDEGCRDLPATDAGHRFCWCPRDQPPARADHDTRNPATDEEQR